VTDALAIVLAQAIQDRISVLFFSVAFLTFMSIAAVPAFIEDKLLFVRERMNGAYRCLVSSLLPRGKFVYVLCEYRD
jgi:ABC-type multidrug transport system permease subunit